MLLLFNGIRTFFAKVGSGWYYILGGLLLAVILAVVLCGIFKIKNKTAVSIFVIVFAIFGAIFSYSLINVDTGGIEDPGIPTPAEIVAELNAFGEDNWKNTNGGFTYEQIKKVQKDSEAPTFPDQIIDMFYQDFGSFKCFTIGTQGHYYNVTFVDMGDNVLFFDGSLNNSGRFGTFRNFLVLRVDLTNWTWNIDRTNVPYYSLKARDGRAIISNVAKGFYDNQISLAKSTASFLEYCYSGIKGNQTEINNHAFKLGRSYAYANLYSNFIAFNNSWVELVGDAKNSVTAINNFYSYLYSVAKNMDYNESKYIDVSSNGLLCAPIAEKDRTKYPISSSKQSDYKDGDKVPVYYGVYNCNIAVNLQKISANKTVQKPSNQDKYIEEITHLVVKPDVSKIEKNEYIKIYVNFKDTGNSKLTDSVISKKPVSINFTSGDITKRLDIYTTHLLNINNLVLLPKNQTSWNYEIESEAIIFENYLGSFTLDPSVSSSLTFKYYYKDNFVVASVGLNPIGTIDRSEFDLANDPVRVVLTNKSTNNVYQFLFDSNDKLDKKLNAYVELGDYTYNILSTKLIFASVTGNLTISSTNKIMLFNYAQNLSKDDLKFNITIAKKNSDVGRVCLASEAKYVDIIRGKLSSNKVYLVDITFFNEDGVIIQNFTHKHLSAGACVDSWTASKLVNNTEYIVQVRFTDANDSTITYLSDVAKVTYLSDFGYEVTYTASVV